MIIKKGLITLIVLIFCVSTTFSQKDSLDLKPVVGFSLRTGTMTYFGELNPKNYLFTSNNIINYGLSIGAKWKKLTINLNYDAVKFGQEYNTSSTNKNFRSLGNNYGFDINYWPLIKRNYGIYIGTGISYMNYKSYTDSLDKFGNKYYYWNDGSIRNESETYQSNFTAKKITKDNVYETYTGKQANLIYPIKIGLMLRFIKDIQLSYNFTYYFTSSKNIGGGNEKRSPSLMYNSIGLTWYLNSYDKIDNGKYYGIDFKQLENDDEDKDGVIDCNDKCFGTPIGISVDKKGCPIDTDGDGVPDYKDKEKNTPKNKLIDINGIGQEPGTGEQDNTEDNNSDNSKINNQ